MSNTSLARPRQRMASRTIGDTKVIPTHTPDSTKASRNGEDALGRGMERMPLDDFCTDRSSLCTSWDRVVTVVAADILRRRKMHVSKREGKPQGALKGRNR